MCSSFIPDCRFDNNYIKPFGDVFCPQTMWSGHKMLAEKDSSISRQAWQAKSSMQICQVCSNPFEEQTKSPFLKFGQGIATFEETQKPTQHVIVDVFCQGRFCLGQKWSMSIHRVRKMKTVTNLLNAEPRFERSFRDQKPENVLLAGDGRYRFVRNSSRDYKKEKNSPFLKMFLRQSQGRIPQLAPKEAKINPFMA